VNKGTENRRNDKALEENNSRDRVGEKKKKHKRIIISKDISDTFSGGCEVGKDARFMATILSNVSINSPYDYQSYISVRCGTTPLPDCSTDTCFSVTDAPCPCDRSRSFPRPANDLDLTNCGKWLVFL